MISKSFKTVIIHGTLGSPEENWIPWLSQQITERGDTVKVPRFPTPDGQNLKNWTDVFEREVGALDGDTMLIGHSAGVAFILRVLEKISSPVHAAFLVAGFVDPLGHPDFDPLIQSFIEEDFNWEKIRRNSKKFYLYCGDNDPWVTISMAKNVSTGLQSELNVIPNGGHLNASAGYTTFPKLLDDYIDVTTISNNS